MQNLFEDLVSIREPQCASAGFEYLIHVNAVADQYASLNAIRASARDDVAARRSEAENAAVIADRSSPIPSP